MATEHFASGSPRPLSERDVRLITQALIGMAAVSEKVTYWRRIHLSFDSGGEERRKAYVPAQPPGRTVFVTGHERRGNYIDDHWRHSPGTADD